MAKALKSKSQKISCTYHVMPDELNNFEEFVTAVNRHARSTGQKILDKGLTMGKIMLSLKKDPATLKAFLKND